MFDDQTETAVAALEAVLDGLLGVELAGLVGRDLLELLERVEVQQRRRAVVDHRLIAEVDVRGVAAQLCVPSTVTLLRELLRVTPGEATARVRAADSMGPRRQLSGAVLSPVFERVAAAQAAGTISVGHAGVITKTIQALPAVVQAESAVEVEVELLEYASRFDPGQLGQLAARVSAYLDPAPTPCRGS
jgi:hypothetical protein